MRAGSHALLSVTVAAGLYSRGASLSLCAASVVAGVLIDVDHGFDYFLTYGVRLTPRHFFRAFREGRFTRMIIPLHSWELTLGLWAIALVWRPHWLVWGAAIGMTHHLIADQFFNRAAPLGYALAWRAAKGFDYAAAFPHKELHRPLP